MADNGFTFWANMKETIEARKDEVLKYKMYDALTEYGLYGIWPEDDGSEEAETLISFVQSMMPSLDKSHNFNKNAAESGAVGGRKQKVTDEQIEQAIKEATKIKMGVPTRQEVVDQIKALFDIEINTKTVSRRCNDDKKKEIAVNYMRDTGDKTYVSEGQEMSQGQNEDKINVSNVSGDIGTQGQNGDINNVSGDKNVVPFVFNF